MDPRLQLQTLTDRILNGKANAYGELFKTADELYKFLVKLTGIDPDEYQNKKKLHLDSGDAIGSLWAAMCIKDLQRTKKFMDAIHHATTDVTQKISNRPVHILYTGTGPFATLILPLISTFTPEQVQFTLLEVNETSFEFLQRLIEHLQLQPYTRQIEKADATAWRVNPDEPVDIFICEALNIALTKEPQAAIFMNIVPQLSSQTVIIPSTINLQAALIDPVQRMKQKRNNEKNSDAVYVLGNLFELNRETVLAHANGFKKSKGNYKFAETIVITPSDKAITHCEFCILTNITIYKGFELLFDESPLTMPLKLIDLQDPSSVRIKCHYETGESPGIRFNI